MSQGDTANTGDLFPTHAIILAGEDLQEALNRGDAAAVAWAVDDMEEAYARYRQLAEAPQSMAAATRSGAPTTPATADPFAGVLNDLQVANLLLAAGQATGEIVPATRGTRAAPIASSSLAEALQAFAESARALEPTPLAPATRGAFAPAQPIAVAPIHSLSLAEATQTLDQAAQATLAGLVAGVHEALLSCLAAITRLDHNVVLTAVRGLGLDLREIPNVGRLIRLGVDCLEKAVAAITAALGAETIGAIKEKIEETWEEWLGGGRIASELGRILAVESARQLVAETAARPDLDSDEVDAASTALQALDGRFAGQIRIITQSSKAVAAAGGLLATFGLGSQAALITAAAYLAVIAWAIATGMDYADAESFLNRVDGVRVIVGRL